jgi:hypothetical protein
VSEIALAKWLSAARAGSRAVAAASRCGVPGRDWGGVFLGRGLTMLGPCSGRLSGTSSVHWNLGQARGPSLHCTPRKAQ